MEVARSVHSLVWEMREELGSECPWVRDVVGNVSL